MWKYLNSDLCDPTAELVFGQQINLYHEVIHLCNIDDTFVSCCFKLVCFCIDSTEERGYTAGGDGLMRINGSSSILGATEHWFVVFAPTTDDNDDFVVSLFKGRQRALRANEMLSCWGWILLFCSKFCCCYIGSGKSAPTTAWESIFALYLWNTWGVTCNDKFIRNRNSTSRLFISNFFTKIGIVCIVIIGIVKNLAASKKGYVFFPSIVKHLSLVLSRHKTLLLREMMLN